MSRILRRSGGENLRGMEAVMDELLPGEESEIVDECSEFFPKEKLGPALACLLKELVCELEDLVEEKGDECEEVKVKGETL